MPNLFPLEELKTTPEVTIDNSIMFGRSWKFDFDKGEFVVTPRGQVQVTEDADAWLEWCRKALNTSRYRYLAYTRDYGQELEDLIGVSMLRDMQESELQRLIIECLMLDRRTAAVENFQFSWGEDTILFSCEISNVRGESVILSESVVI